MKERDWFISEIVNGVVDDNVADWSKEIYGKNCPFLDSGKELYFIVMLYLHICPALEDETKCFSSLSIIKK